ncbi:hypothetical protein C8R45DRAFT_1009160 [Mycena sanguinolenta]|nr:hypothetical protein C8R45DRAFT_1009160 [Mycena sanguinolenta]
MASDNVVSGIVASPEHRRILLELSSKLDLENDPRIRAALRADEERISAFIVSILDSKHALDGVLDLEGNSAQCFLDVIQDALNRGFLMAQGHSSQARRVIRKLSEKCDKLPSSLFIIGVTSKEEHPMFAGGFGDIYRASHSGKTVALKHMRHFIQSSDPEIRDIRLKLCREALVWKDLRHPHILPFLGIDRDSFPSALCTVSPWMEHGTVLKYLQAHGRGNVDKFLYEIAQGLEYLHSRDIIHGDLRGANILINDNWSACLADFGLSVFANATTSMHTSTRAGSLYWMAPELIDPGRFGCKFARTQSSDIYAFGCVCLELYTGYPPFAELSQAAALLRVVNGERPGRPAGAAAMSDALWKRVNAYWAQDFSTRPPAEVVVQEMSWPARKPKRYLRPLPLLPAPQVPLPAIPFQPEPVSTPSSPPVYVQGSPPGYDPADNQRVQLSPSKLAEMEKASKQGPSRELDLAHIMQLAGKASGRALLDQTVILTDGIQTMFEKARQREVTKRDAFVKHLADYSKAGRLHSQDAVFRHIKPASPEPPDPDEVITLPQFVKEAPPLHVRDDMPPMIPIPPIPPEPPARARRPSLPWRLRISPSITSLRYQLTTSKSASSKSTISIPLPNSEADRTISGTSPKSSPRSHRRIRSTSVPRPQRIRRPSVSDGDAKSPRERVRDVGSKTDAVLRGIWRRVMPPVIDTEDTRSNLSFFIGGPSDTCYHPPSPLDVLDLTMDDPFVITGEPAATEDEPKVTADGSEPGPPPDIHLSGNPQKRRSDPDTQINPHRTPRDEDMWRLFECKFGAGNAAQLSETLTSTPPERLLHNSVLEDIHRQCVESQKIIVSQIPWASGSAERSRVAKPAEGFQNSIDAHDSVVLDPPLLTWEEELLLEMLAANEGLLSALRIYDDLMRIAVEREERNALESGSSTNASRDDSSRTVAQLLDAGEPVKVKALKDFIADPDDPEEISFSVGDVLEIVDVQGNWWMVQIADRSADGTAVAPSDYFSLIDDNEQTESFPPSDATHPQESFENRSSFSQEEIFGIVDTQLQWWKARKFHGSADHSSNTGSESEAIQYRAQALYNYTASGDPRELSFKQGDILDIGDTRSGWWPARTQNGLIGIAPSNYLQLL